MYDILPSYDQGPGRILQRTYPLTPITIFLAPENITFAYSARWVNEAQLIAAARSLFTLY